MMEQREKLIELVAKALDAPRFRNKNGCFPTLEENVADILIANGVVGLPCRCGDCINRHNELICPMVISHEIFDKDDGYDVWYEDLTTDDFYCAYGKRKGGDGMMDVFGSPKTLRYQCFAWRNDDGDTVDMVEVVRCKDCKYMLDSDKGVRFCNVWCKVNGLGDNGYCSYGKRR